MILGKKLIKKYALIVNEKSEYYNDWGIIQNYEGDYYYIALNGKAIIKWFKRDEFRIPEKLKKIDN